MYKLIILLANVVLISTSYSAVISEGDYYQYYENFTGTVVMTGGTIVENLYVKQGSLGEVYGGHIGNFLVVDQTSQVWMYGGHVVAGISSPNEGRFYWHGGIIDGQIRAGWRSQAQTPSSYHTIYGTGLLLDGVSVGNIVLNTINGYVDADNQYDYLKQSYWLAGTLEDGSPIDNELIIYGNSTIELVVVPEPATLLLFGLGGLLLRRRVR